MGFSNIMKQEGGNDSNCKGTKETNQVSIENAITNTVKAQEVEMKEKKGTEKSEKSKKIGKLLKKEVKVE